MKKLFLKAIVLFSCVIVSVLPLLAQDKTSVGILPFTFVSSSSKGPYVNSIQETVTNAFVKTKRFNIVDRSKMDALKREKELQKQEDFFDGAVVKQSASLGASYLISGHVISAQGDAMVSDDGKGNRTVTYKAKLSIQLKVIDVSTGQVISSETIEPKAGSSLLGAIGLGVSTEDEAVNKAIAKIEDKIDDFVSKNFPASFSIIEIQEKGSKGDAKRLLIAGGSGFGLEKGDKLRVVEVTTIEVDGKKLQRKKEIGVIKVAKIDDENFSQCTVSDGGLEIATKFDAKAKLMVITKD